MLGPILYASHQFVTYFNFYIHSILSWTRPPKCDYTLSDLSQSSVTSEEYGCTVWRRIIGNPTPDQ